MKIFMLAVGCLMLVSAAAADTIYKYQGADGRMRYSDRPIPGAKLIEAYQHEDSSALPRDASKSDAEGEERIRVRLSNLDAAWVEVKETGSTLAAAEARLAAGVAPEEGEARGLGTPADSAPLESGGPAVAVSPAVGGRMGSGRGGGVSPEYLARMSALETNVVKARVRNQEAWSRYNQLR